MAVGKNRSLILGLLPLLLLACAGGESGESSSAGPSTFFKDVAREAGITHRHHKPILDSKLDNIMTWMTSVGASVAAGDYDGDGFIDLYVTNSRKGTPNFLYRNLGDGSFEDVAAAAGLAEVNGDRGVSTDCVWGDYDNDGDLDLYLVRWGEDALFENAGDGTFTDVTAERFVKQDGSPGIDWANGNAAIFFDLDRDGLLDIYVGNYFDAVDLWNLEHTRILHEHFEVARNGGRNFLFHQEPDGGFVDVAAHLGADDPGWTLAVGSADLNNDGLPDLYIANDFGPDQLFLGTPGGGLDNVTRTAIGLDTKKGMNVDFGDFNNDGWLDAYVTNITTAEYLQEGNMLWHNNGLDEAGVFSMTDVALETGSHDGGWGWGAKFFDYDNDGDLDIVSVNGFISDGEGNYWYDLASWTVRGEDPAEAGNWPAIGGRSFSGYETTRLFRNDDLLSFTEVAGLVGLGDDRDGRGVAILDYDNDGDLDLFIANQGQEPHLYRNDGATGHWLGIVAVADPGTGTNADGVGTRVTVVTARGRQIRERDGGNGYSGQSDPRLHFGLGRDPRVELVEVRWPDGGLQYVEAPDPDGYRTIRQDPAAYVDRVALTTDRPAPLPAPAGETLAAEPSIGPQELDLLLTDLERRLTGLPPGHSLPSTYRSLASRHGAHDRALAFLGELVRRHPDDKRLRIEYANSFIDKLPTCGGIAAIVSKGSLARKALDQVDPLIENDPDDWTALYVRGMNHLHWPRALRHTDDALADFEHMLELQAADPRPYHFRTHVILGDAYTKDKRYAEARAAWTRGLAAFPDAVELKRRLAIESDDELFGFVAAARNLEQVIDTDLSFVDGAAPAIGD